MNEGTERDESDENDQNNENGETATISILPLDKDDEEQCGGGIGGDGVGSKEFPEKIVKIKQRVH